MKNAFFTAVVAFSVLPGLGDPEAAHAFMHAMYEGINGIAD